MNHLIVEVSVGDNCTWWATETHPAFGESPQAFLAELEHKWIEQALTIEALKAELTAHESRLQQVLRALAQAQSKDAQKSPKQTQEAKPDNAQYQTLLSELGALSSSRTALNAKLDALGAINLGGCCLELKDLQGDGRFIAPRVYDLAQYFSKAKERLSQEQQSAVG